MGDLVQKTTNGITICKLASQKLLVLDVEGSDSSERNDGGVRKNIHTCKPNLT